MRIIEYICSIVTPAPYPGTGQAAAGVQGLDSGLRRNDKARKGFTPPPRDCTSSKALLEAHPRGGGFTLIELVLSITITGVLAAVVGPLLIGAVKSYALVTNRQATLNSTRLALERMSAEMKLIPSTDSIDIFQASTFQFDIPSENDINYSLSSGNLLRGSSIMLGNVTSLAFTYLDTNGSPTATKANIKRISVEMTVSAGSGFGTLQLRTQVFPRRFAAYYANFQ